ncbi:MAG TPA: hypothetical protein VK862_06660, partial [Afifellaceae bacterium]|nr:hypothetical protein [Afifellaceae bacterium]
MTRVRPGWTSTAVAGIALSLLAAIAVPVPEARAQGTGGSASVPAETTPDSAALLRDSVRQMLEQAEIERSQAAQYRALAEAAGDAADRAERTARAEALEANAERLVQRAAEMEGEIAEFEAERARFREQSVGRLPDSMIGRWQAAYVDRLDGPVVGEALVRRDGHSIDVEYGGRRYQSISVAPSEGGFIIELQDAQPGPHETDYSPPGQEIAAEAGSLTLSLADGENTVTLATPEPAEPGRVRLVLSADDENRRLTGHWFQRVDAVSGRDDAGGGRNGYPILGSRERGGVVMFGREMWRRPPAVIKLAFATENQAALDEFGQPDWPDPDGATSGGRTVTLAEQRRILYVIGYGLPEYRGEPIAIESLDEDVEYRLHSLEEDMQREDFDGFFGNLLRDARNRIEATQAVGPLAVPITGDETRLLLSAKLKAGAKPGPKTFRINGAEATWHLKFGDHRAEMM